MYKKIKKDTNQEISAGIIIYRKTKEGPKFLLLYNGGGYWNFSKGKLVEGERNFHAALREVYEETGIQSRNLRFADWFRVQDKFTFMRSKKKIHKTVTYYLAETRSQDIKIKILPEGYKGERHDGYGWFLYKEAIKLISGPNMKKHLKYINERIIHGERLQKNKKSAGRKSNNVQRYSGSNRKFTSGQGGRKRPS